MTVHAVIHVADPRRPPTPSTHTSSGMKCIAFTCISTCAHACEQQQQQQQACVPCARQRRARRVAACGKAGSRHFRSPSCEWSLVPAGLRRCASGRRACGMCGRAGVLAACTCASVSGRSSDAEPCHLRGMCFTSGWVDCVSKPLVPDRVSDTGLRGVA